ncbi:MAG: PLP-dependent transferase [Clostridia bacterium]|nr:PLP-dependent transferase [Clostridia bacterium]
MRTPIYDFVTEYARKANATHNRLHMPGHKGKGLLGVEQFDITEIDGADSLYEAKGIIDSSEINASEVFRCPTYYSTEGSSQCIRAMLYMICSGRRTKYRKPRILAGRNAHKTFVTAAAMLDCDVEWLCPQNGESYLSCTVNPKELDIILCEAEDEIFRNSGYLSSEHPCFDAVYITSPDYLGNVSDIRGIADVCHRHRIPLLVDNAHGAYLKFLPESLHPIDLGADICCDSAHKTLPVLTCGAYLHLAPHKKHCGSVDPKEALALFGSTSPSYLILASLDLANPQLESCSAHLKNLAEEIEKAKDLFRSQGFTIIGNEPLKITVSPNPKGMTGYEFADHCKERGFICEYADANYTVFMFSINNNTSDPMKFADSVCMVSQKPPLNFTAPEFHLPKKFMKLRTALFSSQITLPIDKCEGKILAVPTVGCPPAVPIAVCGEKIDKQTIERFIYYGIRNCTVVDR